MSEVGANRANNSPALGLLEAVITKPEPPRDRLGQVSTPTSHMRRLSNVKNRPGSPPEEAPLGFALGAALHPKLSSSSLC